jgi:hypothetical protein
MNRRKLLSLAPALFLRPPARAQQTPAAAPPVPALEETGFHPIFDGKTLAGWDADPDFWRVSDRAILGETTAAHQPRQNTFCIWRGGSPADFELKAQYRITGGNSGFQYRSVERPDIARWVMQGYQADIDAQQLYTGQLYEERDRGFLAPRGAFSYAPNGKKPGTIGSVGDSDQLKALIRERDWNDVHIVARGNSFTHLWNRRVMCMFVDDDPAHYRRAGLIGIQLHVTTTGMRIEARDIRLKLL